MGQPRVPFGAEGRIVRRAAAAKRRQIEKEAESQEGPVRGRAREPRAIPGGRVQSEKARAIARLAIV